MYSFDDAYDSNQRFERAARVQAINQGLYKVHLQCQLRPPRCRIYNIVYLVSGVAYDMR